MTSMPSMRATREVEKARAGAATRVERRARRAEVLIAAVVMWLVMVGRQGLVVDEVVQTL